MKKEQLKNCFVVKIFDIKDKNFKIDEQSLDYKIVEGQLYIEGLMIENQEQKSIGFMSGK